MIVKSEDKEAKVTKSGKICHVCGAMWGSKFGETKDTGESVHRVSLCRRFIWFSCEAYGARLLNINKIEGEWDRG